jgi:hypothetical protein
VRIAIDVYKKEREISQHAGDEMPTEVREIEHVLGVGKEFRNPR